MRTLTTKEVELIKQLRDKVADLGLSQEQNSDDYLVRWLRARDNNLQKSEQLLRNSLKWREENKIDDILNWSPPDCYKQIFPIEICGYNPEGIPVVVTLFKNIDTKSLEEVNLEDYLKYQIWRMEQIIAENRQRSKSGYSTYEFIGIYDLEGLKLSSLINRKYISLVMNHARNFDENYPEVLRKGFFINCPSYYTMMYTLVKPIIPKKTREQMHFIGSDPAKIKSHLFTEIPIEVLPANYGGLNHEFHKTIAKKCNRRNSSNSTTIEDIENEGFIETVVPASEKVDFTYVIDEPQTIIEWCFKTKDYDIGFCVHYQNDDKIEEIHKHKRLEAHAKKQNGSTLCQKTGTYILVFDNSHSRFRSKTLHFKVDVIKPGH